MKQNHRYLDSDAGLPIGSNEDEKREGAKQGRKIDVEWFLLFHRCMIRTTTSRAESGASQSPERLKYHQKHLERSFMAKDTVYCRLEGAVAIEEQSFISYNQENTFENCKIGDDTCL